MSNLKKTYRPKRMLLNAIIVQSIFWIICVSIAYFLGLFEAESSGEKLVLKNPSFLFVLLVQLPILTLFMRRVNTLNKLSDQFSKGVYSSVNLVSTNLLQLRFIILIITISLLVVAGLKPAFGTSNGEMYVNKLELVICLDVSNSMNVRDISKSESRLDISKKAMNQLIGSMNGEKIGICIFANEAYVQLPLTRDYNAAKMFIDDIESNLITSQGTDIAEAFEVANDMFSEEDVHKGIILVTDGENHEGNLDSSIKKLNEKGIIVSALGIGTTRGGLVPKNPERLELGYKTSKGKSILSKVNPDLIKEIASKTKGNAYISSQTFPDMNGMLNDIKKIKSSKLEKIPYKSARDLYQIPLLFVFILSATYLLIPRIYMRRANKLKI